MVCLSGRYPLRLTTVALGLSTSAPSEEGLDIDGGESVIFLHQAGRPLFRQRHNYLSPA
jgi:hypothetical protein